MKGSAICAALKDEPEAMITSRLGAHAAAWPRAPRHASMTGATSSALRDTRLSAAAAARST